MSKFSKYLTNRRIPSCQFNRCSGGLVFIARHQQTNTLVPIDTFFYHLIYQWPMEVGLTHVNFLCILPKCLLTFVCTHDDDAFNLHQYD